MKTSLLTAIASMLILAIPQSSWGDKCVNWRRVMGQGVVAHQTQGPVIVVKPFENFTKKPEDDWLKEGYRDFLTSLLATAESARIRAGLTAQYDPAASSPRYIVGGKFQRAEKRLRVFIGVKDGIDTKILRVIEIDVPYPDNAEFFSRTAEAVHEIGATVGITFNERNFKQIRDATTSMRAFEDYQRGRQELVKYDPAQAGLAKIWFDQTRKADVHAYLSYEGLIDLYTFQGLAAKAEGRPFIHYFQQAETEMALMDKLSKRPSAVPHWGKPKATKKGDGELRLTNRFLKGNAAYLRGITALQADDAKGAVPHLKEATSEVPEDSVAWQKLAAALTGIGDAEGAASARMKAVEMNPCMR